MLRDTKGWQASASPSQVSLYCRSLDTFEKGDGAAWRGATATMGMWMERGESGGVLCNERRFVIPTVVKREREGGPILQSLSETSFRSKWISFCGLCYIVKLPERQILESLDHEFCSILLTLLEMVGARANETFLC